jgi:FKBP-type peptidyl-prolyl cis-trans isomerase 2
MESPMSNAGKTVKVHYVGTLDDGTKFDSSRDRGEALEFVCMAGQMIPGFDEAVNTMNIGELRNVHIEAKDAYGQRKLELIQSFPIAQLPGAEDLNVGDHLRLGSSSGQSFPAVVTAKDDTTVTFDMNHELAGEALNFEIELLEVKE